MIRAPRHFNGTFINRHFFPDYLKHGTLSRINQGKCYDWAYYAHRLFNAQLWTTDFHAWVRWDMNYYDSETVKGVQNFMRLRCNMRNAFPLPWDGQAPKRIGVQEFKAFWDEHGGGKRKHWDTVLEADLRRVLGKRFSEMTPIFHEKPNSRTGTIL